MCKCSARWFVDIKKRKKSDDLNQIWFLAPRNFLKWKRECTFFFLCMHEWVSNTGWRHWQDIFQLLPPLCTKHNPTGATQAEDETSFPPPTSDNGPLPSLISHLQQWLRPSLPTLPSLFFLFFVLSLKANNGLIWICLCSAWGRSTWLTLLQQPLSTKFTFIQITNNKPLKGSFC